MASAPIYVAAPPLRPEGVVVEALFLRHDNDFWTVYLCEFTNGAVEEFTCRSGAKIDTDRLVGRDFYAAKRTIDAADRTEQAHNDQHERNAWRCTCPRHGGGFRR